MTRMKMVIAAAVVAGAAAFGASGAALADGNVPPAQPQGCHGAATVEYKQLTGNPGGQGTAIGGLGNSDQDPSNGQAHSAAGRGAILQQALAEGCGVGSQAP